MNKPIKNQEDLPIEGQDFAKPEEDLKKPSSHGEVANQKHGDFSDLEKSRMENPPANRDTNGSDKNDTDDTDETLNQEDGVN